MATYKESNVFHDRTAAELGRDVRDAQGSWGVTLLCFLSRVMVTKVIIYNGLYSTRYYYTLFCIYTIPHNSKG